MIDMENDIDAENYWNNLSPVDKMNLLTENQFWDGFSVYMYDYIPEDLKEIIRCKIKDK
jgi:hypothetical protein